MGFGLRWSGRLSSLLTGRSCSFDLGSSSLDLVGGGGFHRVPSPLSSFGMWSPFGVNSVFCHYCSRMKVSIGGGFFCDVASHLGVVSSLSYVLCRFVLPGLSLCLPVPCLLLASSAAWPGDLGVLPCYTCGCARTACWACPSPSIRLLVSWFQWVLFSTRVPNLRDGVTPAG